MTEPQAEYTTDQQPAVPRGMRYAVYGFHELVIMHFNQAIANKVGFTVAEARTLALQLRQAANEVEQNMQAQGQHIDGKPQRNRHKPKGDKDNGQSKQTDQADQNPV